MKLWMRATQSSATSFTQARLFTKFVAILYDGISLQVLTFCFRKSPLLLVVLKNFMNLCNWHKFSGRHFSRSDLRYDLFLWTSSALSSKERWCENRPSVASSGLRYQEWCVIISKQSSSELHYHTFSAFGLKMSLIRCSICNKPEGMLGLNVYLHNKSVKAQCALHWNTVPEQTIWEHPRCHQTVFPFSWSRWPLSPPCSMKRPEFPGADL